MLCVERPHLTPPCRDCSARRGNATAETGCTPMWEWTLLGPLIERIPSKKRIDQSHHVSTPRKAKLHMEWKVQRQAGLWQRGIEYHSPTKIAHPYISATSHCQDWPSKWSSWLCVNPMVARWLIKMCAPL